MYSVTKRIDFCYGHRLLDYDGICKHPHGHNAVAEIDLDTGEGGVTKVPLEAIPGGTVTGTPGWFGADPGMVESPDGTRLYALGLLPSDGRQGRSTGIWVFDTRTLNWLDHWTPRALLTSLAVSADGAFVYAAGAPGADADGDVRPWPASITVYDAMSGEVQVLYGSVSADSWITFPSWQ